LLARSGWNFVPSSSC